MHEKKKIITFEGIKEAAELEDKRTDVTIAEARGETMTGGGGGAPSLDL